jgi:hypothetical protein
MEEMREKRFKREFAALVNERKNSALTVLRTFKNARLPETEIMPQGPDFCHFPVISEVLNLAADVEVDVSSFDDIIPLLPELITEWRDSIKQKMMQVIKKHNTSRGNSYLDFMFGMDMSMCEYEYEYECETPPAVGPNSHLTDEELSRELTLASTVFTCICGDGYNDYPSLYDYDSDDEDDYPPAKVLFYPQVMGHSCLARVSKMFPWELSTTRDPSCRLESGRSERKQWDGTGLSLLTIAGGIARDIIVLAGLDPDLATSAEMDQLEVRFKCCECNLLVRPESDDEDNDYRDSVSPIFDWRGAVSRYILYHCILYHLYLSYRLSIKLTNIEIKTPTPFPRLAKMILLKISRRLKASTRLKSMISGHARTAEICPQRQSRRP